MKPETARIQAIAWAQKLISKRFVVLDFETTDKYPDKAEPVQVAIVSSTGETLFKSLVKPAGAMTLDAQLITGITPAMLTDAPSWAEVYETVKQHLAGQTVLIYNAAYDSKVLECTNDRAGLPQIERVKFECAMLPFADFYGDWQVHPTYGGSFRWKKLAQAAQTFGLSSDGAHDAEADCKMTLEVVKAMAAVDMSKPQVFEFEKDTFTILMPGKSPHTLVDRAEGARARILAKITQQPAVAVETPETPAEREETPLNTNLETLEAKMATYARDWAQVQALAESLNLKDREKEIREMALELAIANKNKSPHPAISTSKQPKWLDFDETELLPMAREHMPDLIVECIDAAKLKEAYETLEAMGLLDWALGAIKINTKPVIKFDSGALLSLAAAQRDADHAH